MTIPDSARAVLESDALAHFTPPGYVTRITVDRIAGVGPWAEGRP